MRQDREVSWWPFSERHILVGQFCSADPKRKQQGGGHVVLRGDGQQLFSVMYRVSSPTERQPATPYNQENRSGSKEGRQVCDSDYGVDLGTVFCW